MVCTYNFLSSACVNDFLIVHGLISLKKKKKCGSEEESPSHVLNCGMSEKMENFVDISSLDEVDEATKCELKRLIVWMNLFQEKVNNNEMGSS